MRDSTSANEPRKHHFVPQAFLRVWCANGSELCRMFVRHGKVHCYLKSSTSRVAFQHDLYNLQALSNSLGVMLALRTLAMRYGCDLSELNFERTLMGEIDRKGADALQHFRTTPNAPADQAMLFDLLRFLYLLENRNPLFLKTIQESSVKRLEQLVKSAGLEQSLLLKIDDFRNHLTSAKISVIEAILNEPEFIRRYDGLACILCDIDPNVNRYITSDVPYVRLPGLT